MPKPFRVVVFGKPDCDKCRTLNHRLDKMLAGPDGELFEKVYRNLMTIEGLVEFCEAECLNPQRIPAMLVYGWDESTGAYEPLPRREAVAADALFGKAHLYLYAGLQTDYSDTGKGIVSPKMIQAVLEEAREPAGATAAAA